MSYKSLFPNKLPLSRGSVINVQHWDSEPRWPWTLGEERDAGVMTGWSSQGSVSPCPSRHSVTVSVSLIFAWIWFILYSISFLPSFLPFMHYAQLILHLFLSLHISVNLSLFINFSLRNPCLMSWQQKCCILTPQCWKYCVILNKWFTVTSFQQWWYFVSCLYCKCCVVNALGRMYRHQFTMHVYEVIDTRKLMLIQLIKSSHTKSLQPC